MRSRLTYARACTYAVIALLLAGMPSVGATDAQVLERADWLAHLPLALTVVSFVLVVDALVFARIVRARRRAGM